MEDLGALVSFLRVPVLKNPLTFHKFIASPATSSSKDRFKDLRILLGSICLRRTREILPLKIPIPHVREVYLTPSERQAYNNLVQEGTKQIDMIVSRRSKKKMNAVVLETILSLRLFCNNGSSDANLQVDSTGLPSDPDEALAYLQQDDQDNCAICLTTIYSIDDSDKTDGGSFIASCCHLKEDGTPHSVSGYPPKLLLLLDDIGQAGTDKCIIFSCWKTTLELVSKLLSHHSIEHGFIHGSLSLNERSKVLKEFRLTTGPNILLMTLGTGAVGLNLSIASRIYLLEPQWNPFIEEQAIGRALRLGQQSQVVIFRYITEKTIEQADVLSRQRRKIQLVGGGFGKGKGVSPETTESLRHMFNGGGSSA
ncbi:Ff.00g040430.m01.CDS01 [Fusarium sp. VM40]|nr:Ff.00g040430.m01.CDS01 [Fusarium sp. VM40]